MLPIGSIIAYAGTTNPLQPGWLLCDGSYVSSHFYPTLASVISDWWGDWRGNPDRLYRIPDLRGLFLRGVHGSRPDQYGDPEAALRLRPYRDHTLPLLDPNQVGSIQLDAFAQHAHSAVTVGIWPRSFKGSNDGPRATYEQGNNITDVSGGVETRAKNAYVNYIIHAQTDDEIAAHKRAIAESK